MTLLLRWRWGRTTQCGGIAARDVGGGAAFAGGAAQGFCAGPLKELVYRWSSLSDDTAPVGGPRTSPGTAMP